MEREGTAMTRKEKTKREGMNGGIGEREGEGEEGMLIRVPPLLLLLPLQLLIVLSPLTMSL